MLKNLIFDFDGTIADSKKMYDLAIFNSLRSSGLKVSLRTVRKYSHLEYWESIPLLAKGQVKQVTSGMLDFLLKKIPAADFLLPGAEKSLLVLAENFRIFLASNSLQVILDEFINYYPVRFIEAVGKSEIFPEKEKVLIYLQNKYQLKPGETAYIGDSTGDIMLARKFGYQAIAVNTGWNSKNELEAFSPDKIAANFTEILNFLLNNPE